MKTHQATLFLTQLIEFPDGETRDIAFNTLAAQIFLEIDEEGKPHHIFNEILNHCEGQTYKE